MSDPNGICDRCGFKFRLSQLRTEWTGLKVCSQCYDPRHPQEGVRAVKDTQGVRPGMRPRPADVYTDEFVRTDDGDIVFLANGMPLRRGAALHSHTFSSDDDGFAGGGTAVFSRVGGIAQVTGVSNYADKASVAWSDLPIGATYRVELDVDTGGSDARVSVIEGADPFGDLVAQTLNTSELTHIVLGTFTPTQASSVFQVTPYAGNSSQVVRFDNVQVFVV